MKAFSTPKTKAMRNFLQKEAARVVGLSIEDDGIFIYTNSAEWCDDAGSGTFVEPCGDDGSAASETKAIKRFYQRVRRAAQ